MKVKVYCCFNYSYETEIDNTDDENLMLSEADGGDDIYHLIAKAIPFETDCSCEITDIIDENGNRLY